MAKHTRKKTLISPTLFPALASLFMVIACTLATYPFAAAWMAQYDYSRLFSYYHAFVTDMGPEQQQQLKAATVYNHRLTPATQFRTPIPSTGNLDVVSDVTVDGRSWSYDQLLTVDDHGLMGRISIPKISVDIPIYHGTDEQSLAKGAGHMEGTSLPIGGPSTRSVITAHRGLSEAPMFTRLTELHAGDTFMLSVFGQNTTYQVTNIQVVDPEDIDTVTIVPGKDLVTLVTCTPLGINTQRLLVTAERTVTTSRPLPLPTPGFPWWLVAYLSAMPAAIIWGIRHYDNRLTQAKHSSQ